MWCCTADTIQDQIKIGHREQVSEREREDFLPNQACWSPWTSIARPKSANFTAAPFILLASNRFSGWAVRKHTPPSSPSPAQTTVPPPPAPAPLPPPSPPPPPPPGHRFLHSTLYWWRNNRACGSSQTSTRATAHSSKRFTSRIYI